MRILLSDGHCQLLHVVGAVVTTSASPGHRESVCTSSVMCGRAAESVSAAAGSLAAVAAHLLLCPLSPLFQAARPSWASRRLRDPVFLFRVVSYTYAEWFVRLWEVWERKKSAFWYSGGHKSAMSDSVIRTKPNVPK